MYCFLGVYELEESARVSYLKVFEIKIVNFLKRFISVFDFY